MGRSWIPYAVVLSSLVIGVLLFSLRKNESESSRTINKPNTLIQNPVLKSNEPKGSQSSLSRGIASQPSSNSVVEPTEEKTNPLDTAVLREKRTRKNQENEMMVSIQSERRAALDLQFVGGGKWTFFPDLQVTREMTHQPMFSMGPFHVSRRSNQTGDSPMNLIYDENQKVLGVLTGRVVVKVKDNYDLNPIVRDYELKIDNSSPEIRTAYLNTDGVNTSGGATLVKLNESLKADQRVERFYFEIVRTDWVKN